MAGTKRKHELAELGDLSGNKKVSNCTVSTTDVKQPSSPVNEEQDVICYICHETEADEDDQLRRDCACRGTDAGFVHLSCLTKYASSKSKQARGMGMNEFRKPWWCCPSCHQYYQNELAIDIATEFDSFVRRQYPRDTRMQVEALNTKLRAFDSMFERLQPVQKREAGVTANVQLSLIDQMKGEVSPLPRRYYKFEAKVYNSLGCIALDEGTEDSARRAVVHLEKALAVSKAIGDADEAATTKANIAIVKSKYESDNNEELVRASQEIYELRVAKYGKEHELTIDAGKIYALKLHTANGVDEARALLTKLLITSKQVFGPDHNNTKEVELALKSVNKKLNTP